MIPSPMRPHARRGSLLIIVAAIAAMMLSMTMVFLVRMRTGAEEADQAVRETSAHIMLMAACNYIQETARIGWDDPLTSQHEETFGWIDVRDGSIGPKDQSGAMSTNFNGSWRDIINITDPKLRPSARCVMNPMRRPPYAIAPVAAPNPIAISGTYRGLPYVRNPDPIPANHPVAAGQPAVALSAAEWADYVRGDPTPMQTANEPTWFRVFREGRPPAPATPPPSATYGASFVVTCGCGGTMGWKTWQEIPSAEQSRFNNDPAYWQSLRDAESILWYRIEWSASVATPDYYTINNDFVFPNSDHYFASSMNATTGIRSQPHNVNMTGTIRYVQRLMQEPDYW